MSEPMRVPPHWVRGDFNGYLDEDLLCVAHDDHVIDEGGRRVDLAAGMDLVVYELDPSDEDPDDALVVHGRVEPSPPAAQCRGSRWSLRIAGGTHHWSELDHDRRATLLRG